MKDNGYYLGLDLGSVSLDGVIIDEANNILWHTYRRVLGCSNDTIISLCRDILEQWVNPHNIKTFKGAKVTGSGKEMVSEFLGIPSINEIIAHGYSASLLTKGRASVIEIGGQDSKFILIDDKGAYDYSMNELCAAGTGAFLDTQAERLGLSIEELSEMAANAKEVPSIAGRCSVFAKSDIIHLQQRAVPIDQIVAGLCYALVRNYIATLIRGREIIKPVIFQGGVALNQGVIRAFKNILNLIDTDIRLPDMPHMAGALGAAYLSKKSDNGLTAAVIKEAASQQIINSKGIIIQGWRKNSEITYQLKELESVEWIKQVIRGEKIFIGLDVGSISTKAVALSLEGELIAKVYINTSGNPLEAAKRVFKSFSEYIDEADVAGVGVTGSGRKLLGHATSADIIIDEITSQAIGVKEGFKEADTVIEIGGQDAKFIRLSEDGNVDDFEMNRICSAGTGSFIQEQAIRLHVDLKTDYSMLALSSQNPLPFASRCTVFMESDLVHHIQQGVLLPDLLMGISHSVVENYIDRVVHGRQFGKKIVIQGGLALNLAVVKAFKTRLKDKEVMVHPYPEVSGAIGIAILMIKEFKEKTASLSIFKTSFKGFDFSTSYKCSSFECKGCENHCDISVFLFKDGRFHFGDLCGRYSDLITGLNPGKVLLHKMNELLNEVTVIDNPINIIGIPMALLYHEFFPFWLSYFHELNIKLVVSGPSDRSLLSDALLMLPAETCLPVKLLFGHVAALKKQGVDTILISSMSHLMDGVSCPYIQHGADIIRTNFKDIKILTFPLVTGLSETEIEHLTFNISKVFGLDKKKAVTAYERASEEFNNFQRKSLYDIQCVGLRERPLVVLLGKPYNINDTFMNMSLSSKLAKAGFDVISDMQIDIPESFSLPKQYNNVTWVFSRRMLKKGIWINKTSDIYPVIVGNFGCGPDSFAFPLLQDIFKDRPSLFLEFDEHSADAGLETRVEAFARRVYSWRLKEKIDKVKEEMDIPWTKKFTNILSFRNKTTEYILPHISDHAYAFAGAIAARGFKARVLPFPDNSSYEAGIELSGGKQCHPFQLMTGDIVKLVRSGNLPEGACYLLPSTESSCLITQYAPTLQQYMDKLGRSDVKVINISSFELLHRFGAMSVYNLGKAMVGIEYLSRLRFEMRPYEKEKGSVDKGYNNALQLMYQRQIDNKINQGIMEAAALLDAVSTTQRRTKPVIAITGDVYTRINPAANGGLFEFLEELGCEVWPSPTLIDVIMTGEELKILKYWEAGKPIDMMSSWGRVLVYNFGTNCVIKNFKGRLTNLIEPNGEEVIRNTKGLLSEDTELLVMLNIAKHVDFASKGVNGILNVYCLNCIVGTITTSVFKGLAERTFGIPIMPLVLEGMGWTHMKNRVEAFVYRVKRNCKKNLKT